MPTADKLSSVATDKLSSIAISQPHAAYTSFTHGLISRWLYVSRTALDTSSSFHKLEKALLTKFIPALTGLDSPGTLQRSLFALPTRFGGLGIVAPDSLSPAEFSASLYVTAAPLRLHILSQNFNYGADIICSQLSCKMEIKESKMLNLSTISKELFPQLTTRLQITVGLAQEKGVSSWLKLYLCRNMAFLYIRQLFETLLHCGMVGYPPEHHLTVHVAVHSLLIMHCHVRRVGYNTMR